jgi:hypothetical protein
MSVVGFIFGIISIFGLLLGLIPLLGWFNWLNIPFAILGLVFSVVGTSQGRNRSLGVAGIILCSGAILVGILRLILGGGII